VNLVAFKQKHSAYCFWCEKPTFTAILKSYELQENKELIFALHHKSGRMTPLPDC